MEPDPPHAGPSRLIVRLTDAEGVAIRDAEVEVEGNMTHPGMQPLHAKTRVTPDGSYDAPFSWSMPGDWFVTVTARLADGRTLSRRFDLEVGGRDGHGAHEAHGEGHAPARVPNDGAVVRLVSPSEGASFRPGEDVRVEIEVDDFTLGEEGTHWHVYVDGASPRMIMGTITETMLRDLEPGRHEVSVYLAVGSHMELEEGATVAVDVVAPDEELADAMDGAPARAEP